MKKGQSKKRGGHPKSPFRLALEVYNHLEKIHKELVRRRSGSIKPEEIELLLKAKLHTGGEKSGASKQFAATLVNHLEEQVAQSLAATSPFCPGRVFCYWCETTQCEHTAPQSPLTVFSGYNQTGVPVWKDFGELYLQSKGPKIHLIHRDPPVPVTLFFPGKSLHKNQLSIFGAKSRLFKILCQTKVGYIPFNRTEGEEIEKIAITIQAVEYRMDDSRPKLVLNVLGKTHSGSDIFREIESQVESRLSDVFETGKRRINEIAAQRPGGARYKKICSCLKHISSGVEKIYRQKKRRTKHATLRHKDRSRPAGSALKDTERAKPESFLLDVRKHTFVVLGPRCRTHFFNKDGKHVTSIVFSGEEIEKHLLSSRWKPISGEDVEKLRKKIFR